MTQVVKSSGSPRPSPTPAHTIKVKPYEIAVYKTEDSFKSIFIHISFKYLQERLSHCHFSGSVHLQSEPFTLYLIENKRKELSRCLTSVWQKVDPTLTSVSEINPPKWLLTQQWKCLCYLRVSTWQKGFVIEHRSQHTLTHQVTKSFPTCQNGCLEFWC